MATDHLLITYQPGGEGQEPGLDAGAHKAQNSSEGGAETDDRDEPLLWEEYLR